MSGKGVIRLECRPLEATDVKALQRVFIDSLSDLIRREAFDDAEVLEEEVERLNTTIQDSLADDDVKMYVVVKDGAIVGAAASLPPNEIITGHLEIETMRVKSDVSMWRHTRNVKASGRSCWSTCVTRCVVKGDDSFI